MERPLVSVLLPVRDAAPFLPEALASVVAQTLADLEVLVVDDGSEDGSAAVADAWAAKDGRVRVLRQPRRGLVAALERGRAAARGRYLARMDADDVALPERLELQVQALEEDSLAACGGGVEYFPGEHPGRLSRTSPAYALDAFTRCKVHHLRASLLRRFDGVVVWGAGPVGKAFARELARAGTAVAGFVDVDPRKIGRSVSGVPVVSVDEAPRFAEALAIGAVAGEEARARIRAAAAAQGRQDGVDFVAVA